MLLSDKTIKSLCINPGVLTEWSPMIEPFIPNQVRHNERNARADEYEFYERSKANQTSYPGNWRYDPLLGLQVLEKVISYGLSSFGYDVRLSDEFKIFTNINSSIIDPLNFDESTCVDFKGDVCIVPPHSYALGRTIEKFNIPRNITGIAIGKSTYARCGVIVNVTPIEAGFKGEVVIEIFNATSLPLKVYANHGIAQFMFVLGDDDCQVSYDDRGGKYQHQTGITLAKV